MNPTESHGSGVSSDPPALAATGYPNVIAENARPFLRPALAAVLGLGLQPETSQQ